MGISSSSPLPGSIEKGESCAYSFVLSQAAFVLCSLPKGRVGVGLLVLIVANNINKTSSAKILQPERKTAFRPPKKSAVFPVPSLRVCERATVESKNGHSCDATVAIFQARSGLFKPVFGLQYVSMKFKWLTISGLEVSPKLLVFSGMVAHCKYRKHRGRKRTNNLTLISPASPPSKSPPSS